MTSPPIRLGSIVPELPAGLVSVVMPVHCEKDTLEIIVGRVLALPLVAELIIVDDASTDGSDEIIKRLAAEDSRVKGYYFPVNRGKGSAVREGISHATAEHVVIQDADLEYDPQDLPHVLAPLAAGVADVVYGSRFASRQWRRVLYFRHELGNKFLTFLSNLLTDLNLTDMETCYKAWRREVIQNLHLTCDRFGFEPEVTAKLARSPAVFYEVPISYHGRSYEEGKKVTWKDGVAALWFLLKFNVLQSIDVQIKRPWSEVPNMARQTSED
ncbi:MAG: glycosyltransferase family 2 protein [Acidobacteriota bacterium]